MASIFIHNKEVKSVFDLLGSNENDITFSLSWCLAKVLPFLEKFSNKLTDSDVDAEEIEIRLQEHGKDRGFTDIELISSDIFCIIEAKRGWNLPSKNQLERYLGRFNKYPNLNHKLLVISECENTFAKKKLGAHKLGFPIGHTSWHEVHSWVKDIAPKCNHRQKALLEELNRYFEQVITMQDKDSNEVFCVVVSDERLVGDFTYVDVVKKGYYFYPIRGKWPKMTPPTYLAFRNKGKLMSIHYVEDYEVFEPPTEKIPELINWEGWEKCPHYLLKLGKPFKPDHIVRNGKIYGSQHIRCKLDTLFTCDTIQTARDLSKKRIE